ncbi:MAG: hypothetical protein JNM41_04760 [Flavipsychrobacter sp.]|nr:hypothetical protein [Flavipsychrobacter sp.]
MNRDTKQVLNFCIENLEEISVEATQDYYAHLPLCVIDSIFSIGVKYEGVKNTIARICGYYKIGIAAPQSGKIPSKKTQIPVSKFNEMLADHTPLFLAENVYQNRQRTSVKNGILKAEAVSRFLSVLSDFDVEYFQDVGKISNNKSFELCIKNIPGQRSTISLKYFFMLAGNESLIKPDRMILRFLYDATDKWYSLEQSQELLLGVSQELNARGYVMTPRRLDNLIWNYQRAQPKGSASY